MKYFILYAFTLILMGTACKSTETRPTIPTKPQTIAQFNEENSERTDQHNWIDESERNEIWVFVDEFPSVVKGMRDLQQRISMTVNRNSSVDCATLKDEQVVYSFVIDENGNISKIKSNLEEPNDCSDLIEITIRSTEFTAGKVDGKPVSTLFALPVNF